MENTIFVYVDLNTQPYFVGRLWTRAKKNRESATFEYAREWLERSDCFALEPALVLDKGPQHTPINKSIFGAIGDSAPDRWGRMLMRKAERQRARSLETTPRTLMEMDYLLFVNDDVRQGALRFTKEMNGDFLAKLKQKS